MFDGFSYGLLAVILWFPFVGFEFGCVCITVADVAFSVFVGFARLKDLSCLWFPQLSSDFFC